VFRLFQAGFGNEQFIKIIIRILKVNLKLSSELEKILRKLPDEELPNAYRCIIKELKKRDIIRSRNVIGDLGEYLVIKYYNSTPGLPNLSPAPPGTQNVDALSRRGHRYSIKAATGKTTGVFYGLNDPEASFPDEKKFEYVIIAMFDENLILKRINELSWDEFLRYKRWHSRMRAWNLSITKELLRNTKTIFKLE